MITIVMNVLATALSAIKTHAQNVIQVFHFMITLVMHVLKTALSAITTLMLVFIIARNALLIMDRHKRVESVINVIKKKCALNVMLTADVLNAHLVTEILEAVVCFVVETAIIVIQAKGAYNALLATDLL